ncbi:MAG: hypothetical protein ACLF0G_17240 [Candidatus Brocadiia bacterium]
MIRGTCPVCGRVYKVEDRFGGMTGKCKACGAAVTVPGGAAQPPDGEAPPEEPQPPPGAPRGGPRVATQDVDAGQRPAPAPQPEAPAQPPQEPAPPSRPAPQRPAPPAEDLDSTHDARSRYEPDHGPTPMEGPWLKDRAEAKARPAPPPPEEEPQAPRDADEALGTSKMVTTIDAEDLGRRPTVVTVACVALAVLAVCFFLYFVKGGAVGAAVAALGAVLGGLGLLRLWTGYWDGLVPALLFCMCVVGTVTFLSFAGATEGEGAGLGLPAIAFLAGGVLAALLLVLAVLLPASREYFGT